MSQERDRQDPPRLDLEAFVERALRAQAAVDAVLSRDQQRLEQEPDGSFRVHCSSCGKSVSSPLPVAVVVRAWVQCPECLENGRPVRH